MRLVSYTAAFLVGLGWASSCKVDEVNKNHCANNEGNDSCRDKHGDAFAFCGWDDCDQDQTEDGCVADEPTDPACYSPCGGGLRLVDDPECTGVADDSSTEPSSGNPTTMTVSTTEPTGDDTTQGSMSASMSSSDTDEATTSPTGCMNSSDCTDLESPICAEMVCVPCTAAGDGDAECAAKDASAPACRDDGQCVQCTASNDSSCEDMTPVCNASTNACEACLYHNQCELACDVETGACLDVPDLLVYVDGDNGSCDDGGPGTMAIPFCTIQAAIDAVGNGGSGVVFVAATAAPYNGSLSIDGGKTIALLGGAQPFPSVTPSLGSTLTLSGAATHFYVEGLRFASNTNTVALSLSDGEVVLDRVEVVQNSTNGSGILVGPGAHLRLRNSVVGANGDIDGPTYGVLADDGTFDILYSTLARNRSTVPSSIRCINGGGGTVRNSIVVSDQPGGGSIDCAGIDVSNSALDEAIAGNIDVDDYQAGWFAAPGSGDFHLTGMGEGVFADVAVWESGDPEIDLDGDARPTVDDSSDFAGADLVP